jgi:hypothetical protein
MMAAEGLPDRRFRFTCRFTHEARAFVRVNED